MARGVEIIITHPSTPLSQTVLSFARELMAIGCLGAKTNQIDVAYATARGIAVFNSARASSRSGAELVIGQIFSLARRLCEHSRGGEGENGWTAKKRMNNVSWEVRGKVVGIIGGGDVARETALLASAVGMDVVFWDERGGGHVSNQVKGRSMTVESVLKTADFVCLLGLDDLAMEERVWFGKKELNRMKRGSYLINNASLSLVDCSAIAFAIDDGTLAGVAMDVCLDPRPSDCVHPGFETGGVARGIRQLRQYPGVIFTDKIGDDTVQAQDRIATEVAEALCRFVVDCTTVGSVNLPELSVKLAKEHTRVRITINSLIHRYLCLTIHSLSKKKHTTDLVSSRSSSSTETSPACSAKSIESCASTTSRDRSATADRGLSVS